LHGRKGGLVCDSIADIESLRPASIGWRARSEWVAGFRRNQWPACIGISGRFASDYAAILKHRLMSDDYQRIELITGAVRRRHWTTEQKLQIIEESFQPGETVSSVARRRGVAPNLLYRWRRLMTEGGAAAVGSDEPVVGSSEVRRLEERVRELERMLGRKTMEVEIFREALAKSESKKPSLRLLSQPKDASR
jgi:transposase